MTEPEHRQSFWTTVPGILTGLAALITAVTGLVVGLSRTDGFRSEPGEPPGAAVAAAREARSSDTDDCRRAATVEGAGC